MSAAIPQMRKENTKLKNDIAAVTKRNTEQAMRIFELNSELEAVKLRAEAAFGMYTGILMQAGTIGEARRWTATTYAELTEVCSKPHTRKDVTDLFERNGLNMKIGVFETVNEDSTGVIYDLRVIKQGEPA